MGYQTVLDKIEEYDLKGRDDLFGSGTMFTCPVHDDRKASAHLVEGDEGRALVYCFAGCNLSDIVEELGLEMSDLFNDNERSEVVDSYVYQDEEGNPLYRVLRWEPKGFSQERWTGTGWASGLKDTRRVLYHLPAITQAEPGSTVYVVEGEKDADALSARGYVATTNPGGSGKWNAEWSTSLSRHQVIIIPDQDSPGLAHAEAIQSALKLLGIPVRILHPKVGKDISDHFAAGYSLADLLDSPVHAEDDAFVPVDWETYESPDIQWLYEPYIPARGRVLCYGKAGSLKSLWVMWIAVKLALQGKKVAYFSLEMRPEQSVARLRKLRPPRDSFKLYTNYALGDQAHKRKMIEALRGYDLIVIDTWNAAYKFSRGSHDDQVAALDQDFFQPIIDGTGATLVVIDNSGHDSITDDGTFVEQQHARGSSAKQDKMDVCIWLRRPDKNNNYLTEVAVTKMRYDIPIPTKELVVAPSDHDGIEFFYATPDGKPEVEAWPWVPDQGLGGGKPSEPRDDTPQEPKVIPREELSTEDRLALIAAERIFEGENDAET